MREKPAGCVEAVALGVVAVGGVGLAGAALGLAGAVAWAVFRWLTGGA